MKFLLFVAIVVGLWFAIRELPLGNEDSADLHTDGYIEVRAVLEYGSTELEMVVVEEKPLLSDCQQTLRTEDWLDTCPDDMRCEVTQLECKETVDKRYLGMLDKRKTHLHFAHVEQSANEFKRRGVMVVWGLTVADSKSWCRSMTQGRRSRAVLDEVWTCI